MENNYQSIIERIEQLEIKSQQNFSPSQKDELIQQIEATCKELEEKLELTRERQERAIFLSLKGRALSCLPEYDKRAEENLSKAIKLNPQDSKCWNALGEIFWKKMDYQQALRCFESSLEHNDKDKVTFQKLSMILRMVEANKTENIAKSIEFAKKAIQLDFKDGFSWYVLANAHLTNFFNGGVAQELNHALKAYQQAQLNLTYQNPDLHFNRAIAYKFLEKYEDSISEFQKAHSLDQSLQADKQIEQIKVFMSNMINSIEQKARLKGKKLATFIKQIPKKIPSQLFSFNRNNEKQEEQKLIPANTIQEVVEQQMKTQPNQTSQQPNLLLTCKIVSYGLKSQEELPASFLAADYNGAFFCLSIYNCSQSIYNKIKPQSLIAIRDPTLFQVKMENKGYLGIRVSDPTCIIDLKKDHILSESPSPL